MKHYFERFKKISKEDWIIILFMTIVLALGLYCSIAFSVKLSQGYTLFGDSSSYSKGAVEKSGPTGSDISVLVLFWILTALVLFTDAFFVFFKKPKKTNIIRKDVVGGKVVYLKSEQKENSHENKPTGK